MPGGAASTRDPNAPTMKKLHLGQDKLSAVTVSGTVWEQLAARLSMSTLPPDAGGTGGEDEALPTEELLKTFGVSKGEVEEAAPAATSGFEAKRSSVQKVQLLDAKQSHLKAIGIHALAASLPQASVETPRGDAELLGALRIVETLACGSFDAFTIDQLDTLTELLPSDEDYKLVSYYTGSLEALGVVERFTLACFKVPFCRERAGALLTVTAFRERCESIHNTLSSMQRTLATVRTSAESGILRRILADALRIYRFVNDDAAARGFRLSALSRFEAYVSADKRSNLLQFLARRLENANEATLADLARLEESLASVGRIVWSDVRHEVEATGRTIGELRSLLSTIDGSDDRAEAGVATFVSSTREFVEGVASAAIEDIEKQHAEIDGATRTLLSFLAVDERLLARPEESLATLHEFILAIAQAHRFQALAKERAHRLALKWASDARSAGGNASGEQPSVEDAEMADGEPKDGGNGGEQLLVDDVANRFEGRPFPAKKAPSKTWPGKKGEQPQGDRSDALLRLLLRRASITGGGRDDDEDDEDDSDFL